MGQICGVACFDIAIRPHDILDKMCEANWPGLGAVRKYEVPLVAMAVWSPADTAPCPEPPVSRVGQTQTVLSVFCGQVVEGRATVDEPGSAACPGRNGSGAGSMPAPGDVTSAARLNGIFAGASWDPLARRLTIATDRYSYRPLYYHFDQARRLLVFSSRLSGIIRSGVLEPRPDWEACSRFMYCGHCLGEETLFRDVFRMPPGVLLTFDCDGLHLTPYWSPGGIATREGMSLETAIEGSGHFLARAVRSRQERLTSPPMVFLSGGLDSRMIAAELRKQGVEFVTFTTRGFHPVPVDNASAAQVAQRLGVPNTFVDLPADFISRYWDSAVDLTEHETDLHQWMLPLVEAIPPRYRVNYDGLAGDTINLMVLGSSPLRALDAFRAADRLSPCQLAQAIIGPRWAMRFLSRRLLRVLSYDAAVAGVADELARYGGTENRLALFALMNRTRRATALAPFQIIGRRSRCALTLTTSTSTSP